MYGGGAITGRVCYAMGCLAVPARSLGNRWRRLWRKKRAPIPMTGVGAHVVYLTLWMVGLPSNATTSMPLYVS